MADELRMTMFNGNGSQDPEQHMFVCEAVWIAKKIQDQDVQITLLATTFRDRALVWYMKFQTTTPTIHIRTLAEIKTAFDIRI